MYRYVCELNRSLRRVSSLQIEEHPDENEQKRQRALKEKRDFRVRCVICVSLVLLCAVGVIVLTVMIIPDQHADARKLQQKQNTKTVTDSRAECIKQD
jgi:flagellar basal body-associated protein FliL